MGCVLSSMLIFGWMNDCLSHGENPWNLTWTFALSWLWVALIAGLCTIKCRRNVFTAGNDIHELYIPVRGSVVYTLQAVWCCDSPAILSTCQKNSILVAWRSWLCLCIFIYCVQLRPINGIRWFGHCAFTLYIRIARFSPCAALVTKYLNWHPVCCVIGSSCRNPIKLNSLAFGRPKLPSWPSCIVPLSWPLLLYGMLIASRGS